MTGIVACANRYHLFCVSTLRIEDMEALFSPARRVFCIRVNNIRHVAVLFDALLENTFILPHWQSVLDKGRFLLSKDGTRYVTASSLSSALSAARNNITSANLGIRKGRQPTENITRSAKKAKYVKDKTVTIAVIRA